MLLRSHAHVYSRYAVCRLPDINILFHISKEMFKMPNFLLELIIVGFAMTIIGLPISWIGMKLSGNKKLPDLKSWIYIGLSLFMTGLIGHIFFEATTLNRMYVNSYCKN